MDQIQAVLKQNKDKIDRIDMFETKHKKFKKEFSDLFQTNYCYVVVLQTSCNTTSITYMLQLATADQRTFINILNI